MFRICIAQTKPRWNAPEDNLKKSELYAHNAADSGADIIIFPEQSATGWDPLSGENISGDSGFIPKAFQKIAEDNSIAVLGSFREKTQGLPRNTSVLFSDTGEKIAKYSKIHLFTPGLENKCFSSGDEPVCFTYKKIKFGLAVCYDLRFSDLFAFYAKAGCECVIIQAAWPCKRMKHWNVFIHSRAIENQCYIAGINTTGETPVDTYCGGSCVVSPAGDTILQADDKEGLFYAEIDTSEVKEERKNLSSLSDRREDLYINWRRN